MQSHLLHRSAKSANFIYPLLPDIIILNLYLILTNNVIDTGILELFTL